MSPQTITRLEVSNFATLFAGIEERAKAFRARRGKVSTYRERPSWHEPEAALARFQSKVGARNERGCMEWSGTRMRQYGQVRIGYRLCLASRVAWIIAHGPIADGMDVCHHCDNPPCCNPAHLFLGTAKDNVADMCAKGRGANGERPRGEDNCLAKLTSEQVLAIRALRTAGWSQQKIATRFGTSKQNVGFIVRRETWTHIP